MCRGERGGEEDLSHKEVCVEEKEEEKKKTRESEEVCIEEKEEKKKTRET